MKTSVLKNYKKTGKVYIHRRADNNEIFYVGMTTSNRGRAFINCKNIRSKEWYQINDNYGCIVEYVKDNLTDKEAFQLEIDLIEKYGRKDKGLGPLVNKTDGGLGSPGTIVSQETRNMQSKAHEGRIISKETRKKLSILNAGKAHNFYGKHLTDEHKQNLSKAFKGNKNHFYGKKHTDETKKKLSEFRSIPVTINGIIYKSKKEACKQLYIGMYKLNKLIENEK